MIEWENGGITSEPMYMIAADNPVTFAEYTIEKDILQLDGWKRFKRITNNQKNLIQMSKQETWRHTNTCQNIYLVLNFQKITIKLKR